MKQVALFAINDGKSRGKKRRGEEKITVAKQKLRFLLQKRKKEKRKLGESETQLCMLRGVFTCSAPRMHLCVAAYYHLFPPHLGHVFTGSLGVGSVSTLPLCFSLFSL